jgi:hypothetical protein
MPMTTARNPLAGTNIPLASPLLVAVVVAVPARVPVPAPAPVAVPVAVAVAGEAAGPVIAPPPMTERQSAEYCSAHVFPAASPQ